ncbi:hypothetical protein ACWGH3_20085 [Streptomyces sp. NPDC054884]|nr:hypothetical protein [Streptomyces sp. ME08-AFT2]MDX3313822.1 hypothetical protein [Streptomyces sp. ME08-AFT2]
MTTAAETESPDDDPGSRDREDNAVTSTAAGTGRATDDDHGQDRKGDR